MSSPRAPKPSPGAKATPSSALSQQTSVETKRLGVFIDNPKAHPMRTPGLAAPARGRPPWAGRLPHPLPSEALAAAVPVTLCPGHGSRLSAVTADMPWSFIVHVLSQLPVAFIMVT